MQPTLDLNYTYLQVFTQSPVTCKLLSLQDKNTLTQLASFLRSDLE